MISIVTNSSQIAGARRAAVALARQSGLDEGDSGRVALVATEMATNLVKHAGGGTIVTQRIRDAEGDFIEILAVDGGPGIADTGRALQDGYSTAGSSGSGLGAIRRQSDRFALWSQPRLGTAIMARVALPGSTGPAGAATLGVVMSPYPGETAIGDGWALGSFGPSLLVADGSGHGPDAAKAADAALRAFERSPGTNSVRLVELIHDALKPTRGAAVAVAQLDPDLGQLHYVGVGNISGALISEGKCQRMVSHNGIAGHVAPRIREFTYAYVGAPTVILHSDGLTAKWNLDAYPGLAASHPSLIAGVLFRTCRRERDDACIVVMRTQR